MSGWKRVKLGDLVSVRRENQHPRSAGSAVIDHFSMPAYDTNGQPERVPATSIRSSKQKIHTGDVLISLLNPWIKRVWRPRPSSDAPALTSTLFMVATPKPTTTTEFLYYLAQGDQVQNALVSLANGTSTSHQVVSVDNALDIEVAVPGRDTQQAIVAVLDAVDRRIDLLRSTREALGTLVVGETSHALSHGTQLVPLQDVAKVSSGYSYRSNELVASSDTALINLKNFRRAGGFRIDGFKPLESEAGFKSSQAIDAGDILVAMTDLTQEADVIGSVVRVPDVGSFKIFVASLDTAVVRPVSHLTNEALYGLLLACSFQEHCRGYANGTTVLHLSREAFRDARIPLPIADQLPWIDGVLGSALRCHDRVWREELRLTQVRDELREGLLTQRLTVSR